MHRPVHVLSADRAIVCWHFPIRATIERTLMMMDYTILSNDEYKHIWVPDIKQLLHT